MAPTMVTVGYLGYRLTARVTFRGSGWLLFRRDVFSDRLAYGGLVVIEGSWSVFGVLYLIGAKFGGRQAEDSLLSRVCFGLLGLGLAHSGGLDFFYCA